MKVDLTLACGLYDRTLALQNGSVAPEGIDLNYLEMGPGELFRRLARHAEFDVSEMSLSTYCIMCAQGDQRLVAIPVFPSRRFRHSDIYVNTNAGIKGPKELVGKRMGAMEYQQTAAVWTRGVLQEEYGVQADQIEWYFGGYDEPVKYTERIPVALPSNVRTTVISDQQCLDRMLESGEIDALMGAASPKSFRQGFPRVARLFPDYKEVEADYYRRTGIFPIMHTVVVKREIYEEMPWVAMSLYKGFVQAKAAATRRLREVGTLFTGLPWLMVHLEELDELMGADPFAYGLENNRHTLETFLRYILEQGLVSRPLTVDELFAPETHHALQLAGA